MTHSALPHPVHPLAPRCPNCFRPLTSVRNHLTHFWVCTNCGGRMVEVQQLRRLMPRPVVDALWRHAHDRHTDDGRKCARCRRPMVVFPFETGGHAVRVDLCPYCRYLWFDPLEYQGLPKMPLAKRPRDLPAAAREALARAKVESLREHALGDELWVAGDVLWWVAEIFVHLPFWAMA